MCKNPVTIKVMMLLIVSGTHSHMEDTEYDADAEYSGQ